MLQRREQNRWVQSLHVKGGACYSIPNCKYCRKFSSPLFIFLRVHFKDQFIRDGPPACIGKANSSGWIKEEQFLSFMHHFVKLTRLSKESSVLLLLDSYRAHLFIDVIRYAKENRVACLSFSRHTSHRHQPLDVSAYGPLKKYVASAQKC